MAELYIITGPEGKSYIGVTRRSTKIRWQAHSTESLNLRQKRLHRCSSTELTLHAAIEKFGPRAFRIETLAVLGNADSEYLAQIERRAIEAYGTMTPDGYNMVRGGTGLNV